MPQSYLPFNISIFFFVWLLILLMINLYASRPEMHKLKAGWGLALTHNPWWSDTAVIAVLVDFQTLSLRASGESGDTKDSWWKAGKHVMSFEKSDVSLFITFQIVQLVHMGAWKREVSVWICEWRIQLSAVPQHHESSTESYPLFSLFD